MASTHKIIARVSVIFIIGFAFLVSGCFESQNALQQDHKSESIALVGTLADSSKPEELAAAPVYTKLALYRRLAAKKLRSGQIDVETAKAVQRTADRVREFLDDAVNRKDVAAIKVQAGIVRESFNELERINE